MMRCLYDLTPKTVSINLVLVPIYHVKTGNTFLVLSSKRIAHNNFTQVSNNTKQRYVLRNYANDSKNRSFPNRNPQKQQIQ